MAKSKKQLKEMSLEELNGKERELRASLFQSRIRRATGQLEDTSSIWRMRKDLARTKTFQTQAARTATETK